MVKLFNHGEIYLLKFFPLNTTVSSRRGKLIRSIGHGQSSFFILESFMLSSCLFRMHSMKVFIKYFHKSHYLFEVYVHRLPVCIYFRMNKSVTLNFNLFPISPRYVPYSLTYANYSQRISRER